MIKNNPAHPTSTLVQIGSGESRPISKVTESLMFAALAQMLRQEENECKNLMEVQSRYLEGLAPGQVYHQQALGIVEELEERLKFTDAIPYPDISHRIGMRHQEFCFLDDNEHAVMAFPAWGRSSDEVQVDVAWGSSLYVNPDRLKKRLHEKQMAVESYNGLMKFLDAGIKGFREANPFIPMDKDPEQGDLVYLAQYCIAGHMISYHEAKRLGNILPPPQDRIGTVEEVISEATRPKTFVIKARSGKVYNYKGILSEEENRYRMRRDDESLLDELYVIRASGWSTQMLDMPFMTDKDAEEIILPIIFKKAYDPRIYSAASQHRRLLVSQYTKMIERGVPPEDIVDIFEKDYGLSHKEMFALAGGRQDQLGLLMTGDLEKIVSLVSCYDAYATEILKETAKIMQISEDDLIGLSIDGLEDLPEEDRMMEIAYGRKIRGVNYRREEIIGYVCDVHCFEEPSANINDDVTNPLSMASVELDRSELLGPQAYRKAANIFEIEKLCEFLKNQISYHSHLDPQHDKEDDYGLRSVQAKDYLEKKLEEIKATEQSRMIRVLKLEDDWKLTPGDHLREIQTGLEKRVIEPLISLGHEDQKIADMILENADHNPVIEKAVSSALDYRRKPIDVYQDSPAARSMLLDVENIRSMMGQAGLGEMSPEQILALTMPAVGRALEEGNIEAIISAQNMLLVEALSPGAVPEPLNRMMHRTRHGGKEKEYLSPRIIARAIRGFMLEGRINAEAIADATRPSSETKIKQRSAGRVTLEETRDSFGDYSGNLVLKITDNDMDLRRYAMIVLDCLVDMNKEDPRNSDYMTYSGSHPIEERISSITSVPRLFPKQGSDDYIDPKAACDVESHYRRGEEIIIRTNDEKADQEDIEETQGQRKEKDKEYRQVEKEEQAVNLFYIIRHEETRRDRRELRKFRRGHDYDSCEEARNTSNFDYDHISIMCWANDYLGREEATNLMQNLAERLQQELGLRPDTLQSYAREIRQQQTALEHSQVLRLPGSASK